MIIGHHGALTEQDMKEMCEELFACGTFSDDDFALAKEVEKKVLENVAVWLDFYDGPGKRRAEYVRSLVDSEVPHV